MYFPLDYRSGTDSIPLSGGVVMEGLRAESPHKFPSKPGDENPVETEVNPDAPKGVEIPTGVRVPKGDRPSRTTYTDPIRHREQPTANF